MPIWWEFALVIEGALERSEVSEDSSDISNLVGRWLEDADEHGLETEIYVTTHYCATDAEECVCAQYVTDGHPYATANVA